MDGRSTKGPTSLLRAADVALTRARISQQVDFRILGPLEVIDRGRDLTPARAKQRSLLAVLLLHANQVVARDQLIDALWGEAPPVSASSALHGHISALRKVLGSTRIETRPPGYVLQLSGDELDLTRFESLMAEARAALDVEARARGLRAALDLWRGLPLAEFRYEPFAEAEVGRLEELRISALEERIATDLEQGHHMMVVPELERLVVEHPFRERLRGQLMLALYGSGRQADALHSFQQARTVLVEELGIHPGAALQQLEQQILNQDPSLLPAAAEEETTVPPVAPGAPAEERKVVTVLFVDLVDFVRRGERLDPEDLRSLLAPYSARLRAEIERFGGAVEKFIGDAVMAVFGAPVAHEDDAERAVRAGLRILEAIDDLNEQHPEAELAMRAAITTGEAIVALQSRPELGESMVTGDVVNTASRLQQAGKPGALFVDELTFSATRDVVAYEALDPVTVKGKTEPVRIWQAKSVGGAGDPHKTFSPLVGREHELGLLTEAHARALREPSVQLVTLVGEPGVGKSRLLRELRALVADQGGVWREGRCLPYGEGITFWALGEIVKAHAGVLESDGPEATSDKLAAAVDAVVEAPLERDWFHARLAPLVGAGTPQAGAVDSSQSFTAWRRFFETIASTEPLVLSFEDLHWADDALLDFLEHLVDWVTGVPLLVVCTARPELYEFRPGWGGGKRNSTTAVLAPLTDDETSALISALLPDAALPAATQLELLERSGGNPLYAEEFVRMLGDRGYIRRSGRVVELASGAEIPVPDTVQAVIAARLDTLTQERKALLQAAAVVGKVFWAGAAALVAGIEAAGTDQALHELARKELIRPVRSSSVQGEDEYSFWHVLVQDVAYRQIPRAVRAAKHRAAAQWIERIAGERVTDHAELLAHHYTQAVDLGRAAGEDVGELQEQSKRFLVLAGDRALPLDVEKAETYYARALELLARRDPERPGVQARVAEAAGLAGRWEEAEGGYLEAIADFKARGDNLGAGEALVRLAQIVRDRGEPARIEPLLTEAVELLEGEPPGPELVLAYTHLARHEQMGRKDYAAALAWARKAIDTAAELGAKALGARALQYHGYVRFETGDIGGIDDLREALRIGLDAGLGRETATAYDNLGDLIGWTEGPAAGLELYRASGDFSERRGFTHMVTWAKAASVWTFFELGDWDTLVQTAREVVDCDPEGYTALLVMSYEAAARLDRGEVEAAAALSDDFLPRVRDNGDPQVLVPSLGNAAVIAAARGEIPEALGLVEELERATRGHPLYRAHQLPGVARVCVGGRATELAETLLEGTDGSVFASRFRYAAETARATLAEARGALEDAAPLYTDVAARWREHGFVLEQGHALHGAGRCLLALDRNEEAACSLTEARTLFQALGARQLAFEAEAGVEQAQVRGRRATPSWRGDAGATQPTEIGRNTEGPEGPKEA
jgi:class 3 adenylate cyclase/tetratricopeptide (TPR) repeat protein